MIRPARRRATLIRLAVLPLCVASVASLAATTAHAAVGTADAAVTLTATPHFDLLAPSLVYTVSVHNNGPDTLASGQVTVRVADVLTPASGGGCTVNPGSAVCPVGPVAAGATQSRVVTLPINPVTVALTIRATATITAASATDPDPSNNTETVDCTYLTALDVHCS
ncbi:hypothetical protein [Actinacidiphila alni]|uniref:hypothetical protein n=1 Tax=Actinacidiphila alni TaxID=380248 RepID=UPI003453B482